MERGRIHYPVAFGVATVGGLLIVVSTFLPITERSGPFAYVQQNSVIQHGGWIIAAAGLGVIYHAYATCTGKKNARWLAVVAVIASGFVIWMANDAAFRTLYPVGVDGGADMDATGIVAPAGIAAYVAGFGAALAVLGAVILLSQQDAGRNQAAGQPIPARPAKTKPCPDCAETILSGARVCRHCGYRFTKVPE